MTESRSILILGSYPPPYGGISTHLHSFVPHLVGRGHKVDVVSSGKERSVERHDGFTVHRLTQDWGSGPAILRRAPAAVQDLATTRFVSREFLRAQAIAGTAEPLLPGPDLICAYHLLPWGLAGACLAARYRVPLLMVNFGEYYVAPGFYRRHQRVIRWITERAGHLVSVSRHCARSLALLGIDRPLEVIPMGVDVKRFSPDCDGSMVRDRYRVPPGTPLVLFVGRMIRDMGLHTLLEAMPSIARRATVIVAGARGDLTASAEAAAAAQPGRVHVVPDAAFGDLPGYYSAADVILAPSPDDRSCMGLAIKEAMATGKPVVACRAGGVPEAVSDGETGVLTPPEDARALAAAVTELLDDPSTRDRMGRAARQRAIDLFSVDVTNRRMEAAYDVAYEAGGATFRGPAPSADGSGGEVNT